MNRREALSSVAILLGGSIVGGELFAANSSTSSNKLNYVFTANDIAFLNEVGETIIPETKTPGAKAANVGDFMRIMVRDCYTPRNQEVFIEGMKSLNTTAINKYGRDFMGLNKVERTEFLTELDNEQRNYQRTKKGNQPSHYFRMMRELTLLGYFTSEVGATQQVNYLEVPGRYEACIDYKKGDKQYIF